MILNSLDKQFALSENGQITWQKDLTNPMPGEVIAEVIKGESVLQPSCSLVEASPAIASEDKDAVLTFVKAWLDRYIAEALAPLMNLKSEDISEGAPKEIAEKLHDAMGVIPRADLQDLIAQMDEEKRNALRSKKIRFGPLLVYLPELNKPAAVRLRALLLNLWADQDLPASVPADGIVSFSVEGKELDKNYYQSIGYPIYGPRSIRVDMLDRVICAVYDSAKEGKFMAQHQMAEWLGSNISDLYAVLEAMGHTKIQDPADNATDKAEDKKPEDVKDEADSVTPKADEAPPSADSKPKDKEQKKPDLAIFRLKKGKASESKPRGDKKTFSPTSKNKRLSDTNFQSGKKKFKSSKGKKPEPRKHVYVAEAEKKPEDSPFAILEQLKTGAKDK